MKRLLSFASLLVLGSSFGQSVPTLLSWEIDTLCNGTTETVVQNIQIQDMDADSTWIVVTNYDALVYAFVAADPAPALVGGQQIRTFTIYGTTGTGIPAGLNLSNIDIDIYSDNGLDVGGPWTDVITNSAAYGDLGVNFNMSSAAICTNDQPVDLNQWASPLGGEFKWGDENHEGNMFDPVLYLQDPSNVTYTYTNAAGCEQSMFDTPIFLEPPVLTLTPSSSTCGNADGSALLTIAGSNAPWNLYWSTGTTVNNALSSENLMNLPSGAYYANVTNVLGCKATIGARISDSDVTITPIITDAMCHDSYDGAIDLTISTSGTVTDIWWSNGQSTEDISGIGPGEYAVEVHTDMNCNGYEEFTLNSPPPIDVDMVGTLPADCQDLVNYGNSAINITTSGGAGGYMWDWNDGAFNTENLSNVPSGPYKCVVTDANGCSLEWWMNLMESNGPQIYLEKINKTTCGLQDGIIDVSIFQGASPIVSTLWDNGYTTEDMIDAGAGVYKVDVTDANGCVTTGRYRIPTYRPATPQICLLTVDTTQMYNTIVWEKNGTMDDIAEFNIYRETTTVGEYELVASRPYSLESDFIDNAASSVNRSWRYYITAVDTCGFESFPSFPHKTIHCVIQDMGPTKDVYWDDYEGITYTSVNIHRYDDVNGWVDIQTNYTGGAPYTDTPTETAGLDYRVSFNLAQTCTATKAQSYNSSRSNNGSGIFEPGETTVSIQDEEVGQLSFYPNPTNTDLNVYIENTEEFDFIELIDQSGKLIAQTAVLNSVSTFDMSNYASGVYIVKLIGAEKTINQKIIRD